MPERLTGVRVVLYAAFSGIYADKNLFKRGLFAAKFKTKGVNVFTNEKENASKRN